MARKKTTVYIEEDLLRQAKIIAARTGRKEYEVFEDALRQYTLRGLLEQIWARSDLSEQEAFDLADREVHRARARKRG